MRLEKKELRKAVESILNQYYSLKENEGCLNLFSNDDIFCKEPSFSGDGCEKLLEDRLNEVKRGSLNYLDGDSDFIAFQIISDIEGIVLDIGANWGYSVPDILRYAPKANVISFEPISFYRSHLESIKKLLPNEYTYFSVALSDSCGALNFMCPCLQGKALDALYSGKDKRSPGELSAVCDIIVEYADSYHSNESILDFRLFHESRPVSTLDMILRENRFVLNNKHIVGIKIDVEGLEDRVIYGAVETIRQHKPKLIMLESGNRYQGLSDFMETLNYSYYELVNKVLTRKDTYSSVSNGFYIADH